MISFQQTFADLSGLLLVFPDVTGEMTIEELLVWIKNILEADEVAFEAVEKDEDQSTNNTELA